MFCPGLQRCNKYSVDILNDSFCLLVLPAWDKSTHLFMRSVSQASCVTSILLTARDTRGKDIISDLQFMTFISSLRNHVRAYQKRQQRPSILPNPLKVSDAGTESRSPGPKNLGQKKISQSPLYGLLHVRRDSEGLKKTILSLMNKGKTIKYLSLLRNILPYKLTPRDI